MANWEAQELCAQELNGQRLTSPKLCDSRRMGLIITVSASKENVTQDTACSGRRVCGWCLCLLLVTPALGRGRRPSAVGQGFQAAVGPLRRRTHPCIPPQRQASRPSCPRRTCSRRPDTASHTEAVLSHLPRPGSEPRTKLRIRGRNSESADETQAQQARPSSRAAKGHQGRPASDEFGAVRRESNRDHRPRLDAGCLSPQCPASSAARRSREGAGSFRRKSVRGARGVPRRTQRALHLTVCPTPEPAHTPHARGHFERTAPTVREGIRDQCVACWALPRHRSPR